MTIPASITPPAGAQVLPQVPMLDLPPAGSNSGAATSGGGQVFQQVFADALQRVEQFQATSQSTIGQFLAGADVDLHEVAINVQKAETAFELFAEVRNKVVQAYQEIMRIQV